MNSLSSTEASNNATAEPNVAAPPPIVGQTQRVAAAGPTPATVNDRITALVETLGLTAGSQRSGNGVMIRCLWHSDTTPSCSVHGDGARIFYKCFACEAKGGVQALIARAIQLNPECDARRAREIGADVLGTDEATLAAVTTPTAHVDRVARKLLAQIPLEKNETVAAYLSHRGVLAQAVEDGWGALPDNPADWAPLVQELGADAATLGLTTPKGSARLPQHRLVIPWRSPDGEIFTIQRRILDGAPDNKYIFPKGLGAIWPYGCHRVTQVDVPIAIVEGAMDVLAMRALCAREGIERDVIGLPSVQAWRTEWGALVSARVVLVAVDDDDAGNRTTPRIAGHVTSAGAVEIRRRRPNGAKDWASLTEVR